MRSAILLLGATGTGKTPLGERLEKSGLDGRRCVHFDFGACLRKTAEDKMVQGSLSAEDIDIVKRVLATGALLEDSEFHIAKGILLSFLDQERVGDDDIVVLNGLPRHRGQTRALEDIVDIKKIIYLWCTPDVIYERIRLNSGGDRVGRIDDSMEDIKRKLEIFEERTMPLLDYYKQKGIEIYKVQVNANNIFPSPLGRGLG